MSLKSFVQEETEEVKRQAEQESKEKETAESNSSFLASQLHLFKESLEEHFHKNGFKTISDDHHVISFKNDAIFTKFEVIFFTNPSPLMTLTLDKGEGIVEKGKVLLQRQKQGGVLYKASLPKLDFNNPVFKTLPEAIDYLL